MPPKAMNKTDIDDLLCELMPKDLSKGAKLSIINDVNLKSKNIAYEHNYNQLTEVASTIDITLDYRSLVINASQCVESIKNIFKQQ